MLTFSLCLIVKDEVETLDNLLKSAKSFADEIIIVHTFDNWETKKVASRHKAKTYSFTWIDDFAAARNYAFSKATKDYIIWADADDIFPADQAKKIAELKHQLNPQIDCLMLDYHVNFDDKGNCLFKVSRERILKRSCNFQWKGAIHEYIDVQPDKVITGTDIYLIHTANRQTPNADRNLRIYRKLEAENQLSDHRDFYHYGNELYEHQIPDEAIIRYEAVLNHSEAWAEHQISATGILSEIYKGKGDMDKAIQYSLNAFKYAPPRAEACVQLANLFLIKEDFEKAIFWCQLALQIPRPQYHPICMEHCWGITPHSILAMIFARLGNLEASNFHNEKFLELKPEDDSGLANRAQIQNAIAQQKQQQIQSEIPVIKL